MTESEWLGNDEDDDPGVRGVGLMVSDEGELVIVHIDGGLNTVAAYRVSETEASGLASMIDSVLG